MRCTDMQVVVIRICAVRPLYPAISRYTPYTPYIIPYGFKSEAFGVIVSLILL